jgi:hypothetical protein
MIFCQGVRGACNRLCEGLAVGVYMMFVIIWGKDRVVVVISKQGGGFINVMCNSKGT